MSIYETSHCFITEEQNFYAENSPSTLLILKWVNNLPPQAHPLMTCFFSPHSSSNSHIVCDG